MVEPIESLDDPRLDDYRNVSDPELLARGDIFMAEGRLVVARLLQQTRIPVRSLLLTSTARAALQPIVQARPDVPLFEVSQTVMNAITGFNIHRGCLAVGVRPDPVDATALAESARRLVVVERIANADNVGSIFRNAAALDGDGIVLDHASTDPLYRKALRTSMGAALRVPYARVRDLDATLTDLKARGWTLLALTPSPDAPPLGAVVPALQGRVAVLAGHEGEGLLPATMALCTARARIPMTSGVDSLNVAAATAIALYELQRADHG